MTGNPLEFQRPSWYRNIQVALEKNQRYGKTVENWAIRSQAPNVVMQDHGEGSETRW